MRNVTLKMVSEIEVGDVVSTLGTVKLSCVKINKIEKFTAATEIKIWFGTNTHDMFKWCSPYEEVIFHGLSK